MTGTPHSPTVVLAAGGTGGHVFPALAVAERLRAHRLHPVLVTDVRGAHYDGLLHELTTARIAAATLQGKSLWQRVIASAKIMQGIFDAWGLLRRLRPLAVVGFGGYPSFPTLVAAKILRISTILHEQNAVLGRVNRILQTWVDAVALSFANTAGLKPQTKGKTTGNPVRPAMVAATAGTYPAPGAEDPVHLLIFGGSLGARIFSDLIPPALALLPNSLQSRLRIVQQCREEDLERVRAAYKAAGIDAELAPFFSDMPKRLAAAHLVICRSGAGSVAELAVAGRPALLFPYPHHKDQQQKHNAEAFVAAGAGQLFADATATPESIGRTIKDYLTDPEALPRAAAAAKSLGQPDAADKVVNLVMSVAKYTPGSPNAVDSSCQKGGPA